MPLSLAGHTPRVTAEHSDLERVWVAHTASRVTLQRAHAVSREGRQADVTRAACGLVLRHEMIRNIPSDGASPCGQCLAATVDIVGLESI